MIGMSGPFPTNWYADNDDGEAFSFILQGYFEKASHLSARESEFDEDKVDLNKRLVKINSTWYVCKIEQQIIMIYGLDTGTWVAEIIGGVIPVTQYAENKQKLFDALGIDNDTPPTKEPA